MKRNIDILLEKNLLKLINIKNKQYIELPKTKDSNLWNMEDLFSYNFDITRYLYNKLISLQSLGFNYLVKDKDGKVRVTTIKPYKHETYWISGMNNSVFIENLNMENSDFHFINWEDEPILIDEIIKNYKLTNII